MAKINIIDLSGSKKADINTEIFDAQIREDIIQKVAEIERLEEQQPYAPYLWAGMQTSASGNVKHNRHVWKTDRGKGMSRFPKKRMSDKGDRFTWVGAVSPDTRKGRRAHSPKIARKEIKINKKEQVFALKSALAFIASNDMIKKKYSSLADFDIKIKFPLIFEDKITLIKSKEFFEKLENLLGEGVFSVAIQEARVRPGVGKMRNRRYKKNAGLLLVIGNKQEKKISGIDVVKAKDLRVVDLASNGARLVAFTEEAVKDLENKLFVNKDKKMEKKA